MAALLSNSARVALRSGASATSKAGAAGLTFARGKATLPDLSCKLGVLIAIRTSDIISLGFGKIELANIANKTTTAP